MKIGTEVEGRFIGLKTLFLTVEEYETKNIREALRAWSVQQIYISDHANKLDITDMNVDLGSLALSYVVTVERTKSDELTSEQINVMLVIENDSFWHLTKNDQVKFTRDLHVYTATKGNMTETWPEQFNGDFEIEH